MNNSPTPRVRPRALRFCFLYVRFKYDISLCDPIIEKLAAAYLDPVAILEFRDGNGGWSNGLVLALRSDLLLADLASAIGPALADTDRWMLVDSHGDAIERPDVGMTSLFFERLKIDKGDYPPFSQIFVRFAERDRDQDGTSELLRALFRDPVSPIFHFEDGKIFMLSSQEPDAVIANRWKALRVRAPQYAVARSDFRASLGFDERGDQWSVVFLADIYFQEDEAPKPEEEW